MTCPDVRLSVCRNYRSQGQHTPVVRRKLEVSHVKQLLDVLGGHELMDQDVRWAYLINQGLAQGEVS